MPQISKQRQPVEQQRETADRTRAKISPTAAVAASCLPAYSLFRRPPHRNAAKADSDSE